MMRRDILLHFYYHFGSSAGIAQVPRGEGGGGKFSVYNSLTGCGASSWNTQNSQKSLVFSENSDGDNS